LESHPAQVEEIPFVVEIGYIQKGLTEADWIGIQQDNVIFHEDCRRKPTFCRHFPCAEMVQRTRHLTPLERPIPPSVAGTG
jgi:hypothetical protein